MIGGDRGRDIEFFSFSIGNPYMRMCIEWESVVLCLNDKTKYDKWFLDTNQHDVHMYCLRIVNNKYKNYELRFLN